MRLEDYIKLTINSLGEFAPKRIEFINLGIDFTKDEGLMVVRDDSPNRISFTIQK